MPIMRQTKLKCATCLAAGLFALPVQADRALVVSNFAYDGQDAQPQLQDRALEVSRTLFGLGYTVDRLANEDAATISAAFEALASEQGDVVVYYVGQSRVENGQTQLLAATGDATIDLTDALGRAGVGARDATMVFLDVCTEPFTAQTDTVEDEAPVAVSQDGPAPTDYSGLAPLPAQDGLFMASSVVPGQPCAAVDTGLTEVMLDRLLVPGLDTDALFADTPVTITSSLAAPHVFRQISSGMSLTAEDYRMLDNLSPAAQDQMIAMWAAAGIAVDRAGAPQPASAPTQVVRQETVVLNSPLKPVSSTGGGATLVPVSPTVTSVRAGATLAPRNATPDPTPVSIARPVPGAGGLPQPSIIVGREEEVTEASFNLAAAPTGPITGAGFDVSDIEVRRTLRDSDPGNFATLVSSGAFDPAPAELVVALQTELSRMECYTSTIDGQWGRGSRGAVTRYYEEIDGSSPSQDPDVAIYRQIMLRDDVICPPPPAPVQTAAPVRTTPRTSTPRRQTQAAPAPRPAAPAAAAPAPQPSRTIRGGIGGSGRFR